MSETKKIVIQQNNGTDYDKLYPQVDAYTKSETLTSNTSQLFGITNGTPEQILQYLGKYAQFWWLEKTIAKYSINRVTKNGKCLPVASNGTAFFYWGDGISFNEKTGEIFLTGDVKQEQLYGWKFDPAYYNFYNKYIYVSTSSGNSNIIYIPTGSVYTSNTDGCIANPFEEITSVYSASVFHNYVQSNNRSTYPDSGEQDGYNYTYLGVPLANAALLKISDKI